MPQNSHIGLDGIARKKAEEERKKMEDEDKKEEEVDSDDDLFVKLMFIISYL